jgi:hypothetical protein
MSRTSLYANDAAEKRASRRNAKARENRAVLVAEATPETMAALGLSGPLSRSELTELLGVTRTTMRDTIARNADELMDAGWSGTVEEIPPAVAATVALIIRPATSPRVCVMHRALNPAYTVPRLKFGTGAGHVAEASAILDLASDVIGRLQQDDPAEVWRHLRDDLDDHTRLGLVVALASMVPLDHPEPRARLRRLDPERRSHRMGGSPAAGLSQLIPSRATSHGMPAPDLTDEAVGL